MEVFVSRLSSVHARGDDMLRVGCCCSFGQCYDDSTSQSDVFEDVLPM